MARTLVRSLRDNGLWLDFRYHGRWGAKKLAPLGSDDELVAAIRAWKPGEYALLADATEELHTPMAQLSVGPGGLGIGLVVAGGALERRRSTLLHQVPSLVAELHRAFAGDASLNLCSVVTLDPYPRPRPPRRPASPFNLGTLLDVYDLATLRKYRSPEEIDAVTSAPLPEGAGRERHGDLVVIRWVRDLSDAGEIAAARSRQERWIASHVELELDPDFNERGDRKETVRGLVEHPPLTFHDPSTAVGYKAIVASPDGKVDERQWKQLAGWVERRQLPDGTALAQLRLVVPLREAALAIADRARKAGIDAVLYTDDQGQWWNPAPPGPWLDPE